ncbi:helix-turn-helix domain-containing protein [Paenibacillus campi]|uniref:helix-turn-helix domain-containing protein n=1 Tax=Paenibacillus campi TaxID=3106031 RepID=UPI002AFDD298|nr:helix-turn-helix domain-containing protein [Paenibacillus sp. SGZ-1009]
MTNFFAQKDSIAQNLLNFIRVNGYSKLSFSKITGISRPTVDQILKAESPSPVIYNAQINKITAALNVSEDFFLTKPSLLTTSSTSAYAFSDHAQHLNRSQEAKQLLERLDNMLDIYSMYV